jgi:hypothetical protein
MGSVSVSSSGFFYTSKNGASPRPLKINQNVCWYIFCSCFSGHGPERSYENLGVERGCSYRIAGGRAHRSVEDDHLFLRRQYVARRRRFFIRHGELQLTPAAGTISLADLTAFSFSLNTDGVADYSFGLGDLTSFSLSSDSSPTATIEFQTDFTDSTDNLVLYPEDFGVTGTLAAATGEVDINNPEYGTIPEDDGPVTFALPATSVPEPASIFLFGTALVGVGLFRPRKTA